MIIEILIIFLIYFMLMVICVYYYNLFLSKDQFLKEDLKNILPFLTNYWNSISNTYTIPMFIVVTFITSFIGCLVILLLENWVINSALIPALIYFIVPYLRTHFEETQVSVSESTADTAINLFVRYSYIIVIGLCAGIATALIYNWSVYKVIHFLWFLPNIIIVSILIILSMKKTIE